MYDIVRRQEIGWRQRGNEVGRWRRYQRSNMVHDNDLKIILRRKDTVYDSSPRKQTRVQEILEDMRKQNDHSS